MSSQSTTLILDQQSIQITDTSEPSLSKPNVFIKSIHKMKSSWNDLFLIDLNFEMDDDFNEQMMNDLWR